jgi:FMN reductase
MADILSLAGSPSVSSRSSAILDYSRSILERHQLSTESIAIRDFPAEDLLFANFNSPDIQALYPKISAARAVIVATPVYKASYSGALKTLLDILPQNALENKIVLPIATGGSAKHLLSIDYALNPVLAALGARHILQGVYIVDTQVLSYGENKAFKLEKDAEDRLLQGLDQLVTALHLEPILA